MLHKNTTLAPINYARLPYTRPAFTISDGLSQYWMLIRLLLTDYREDWQFQIYASVLTPLALAFFAQSAQTHTDQQIGIYILGGSLTMSIVMGPALTLLIKLGGIQQTHSLDFWIALPVRKFLLVAAFATIALVFALPGFLATYLLSCLMLGLPFTLAHTLLIALIPLAVLPLAGFYAVIAIYLPTPNIVGIASNVITIFLGIFSPLIVSNVPPFLKFTSLLLPTTYAADAFRAVLGGHGTNLLLDIWILALAALISIALVHWQLKWRSVV